jgi:hypothetical protein
MIDGILYKERVDVGGSLRYYDNALLIFRMNCDEGIECI